MTKLAPYWWDDVPRPALPDAAVPPAADVAVVGSGYTGLHAALQTARGGRHTVVFDAEDAGFGCSTRNGGQISTSVKPSYATLAARHGPQRAFDIVKEGQRSLAWIGEFVRGEGLDCDFRVAGRFHAAHNAAKFRVLVQAVENQPRGLEVAAHIVPRAEQHAEIDTDLYFGGAVYEQHASIHPARYHQGLLGLARGAGAQVVAHCRVDGIARDGARFRLTTARGTCLARDVVVATDGYTGALTPWLQRRVIPIGSYMIATEAMPQATVAKLIPRDRIVSDTRKVVFYYRTSPDRTRILFGGRVSLDETDPAVSGPLLRADLVKVFPALREVRITHSWMGIVAYTFDETMHVGTHDGVRFATGYCGAGVGMGSYLGMRVGQQVLGLPDGRTAFDGLPFPTRPFYTGRPWFLAPSIRYFRLRDRLPI
ncbi:MAG: FAD-binding oxidoreductase [Burkholderiales bacterium]|nr:FAD-binding oxidoreductase [Burkholderiales bacterium]